MKDDMKIVAFMAGVMFFVTFTINHNQKLYKKQSARLDKLEKNYCDSSKVK